MSIIDEETIKEYEKLFKISVVDEEVISLALLELIKEIREQNELLNDIQVNIKEVALNLESIKEEMLKY